MNFKKKVVVSAINFFEGGPLSVLKDCLNFLNNCEYKEDYTFLILVHKKELFDLKMYNNITFIEFPRSRKSYVFRFYYEYFYFKKFAKINNIDFWFSLHDMSPSIGNVPQAVYCHNASPFNTINGKDLYLQPTQFFFRLFYKYIYKINIKRNRYIVVQQLWMKNKFTEMFNLDRDRVIVAPPKITVISSKYTEVLNRNIGNKVFFFPTFPRPFKNIEVICEAVKLVIKKKENFEVVITIDGSENTYSKLIVEKYKHLENIKFIGLIEREKVYEYYSKSDCLIFPSKLETWGLPISEYKQFNKPMLVSDLEYAKETVGNYDFVNFFKPNDSIMLSELILDYLNDNLKYDSTNVMNYEQPYAHGWDELFAILLKDDLC